jgi:hypothetical protein
MCPTSCAGTLNTRREDSLFNLARSINQKYIGTAFISIIPFAGKNLHTVLKNIFVARCYSET